MTAEAVASVSVTVLPEIEGAVLLRVSVVSAPPDGVFFTVKAPFASDAAAPSSSLNDITSDVPFTVASTNVGATVSWLR